MKSTRPAQPNHLLRRQRLLRGWTLNRVVKELCSLCREEEHVPGVTADMISKWERGERKPSRFYQAKLCQLYGATADQLGFIEDQDCRQAHIGELQPPSTVFPSDTTTEVLPNHESEGAAEAIAAHLLLSSSKQLAGLTALGWTVQDILRAVQMLLPGEIAMDHLNRRHVLQLGTGLFLWQPASLREHPSAEDRFRLTRTLSESLAAGWKLFHTASPAQILAIAHAQLALLQRVHADIYPSVLPMLYSGMYRLIGAGLYLQGRYEQAWKAHEQAYTAAVENADLWNMGQSRCWQAYVWRTRGNYTEALDVADAALCLLASQNDSESIRLRAHLLAFGAECAALLSDERGAKTRLDASRQLLEYLPLHHEEFDHSSWLRHAGICALYFHQYDLAAKQLQQALDALPVSWSLRYLSTALSLARAYICLRERDQALSIARALLPVVQSTQARTLTEIFLTFLRELASRFPDDSHCHLFVSEAQTQLVSASLSITDRLHQIPETSS